MGRSVPFRTAQNGRAWTLGFIGAIGLTAVFAALDRARVCEGPGCVGDAIGRGVHDTAVALKGDDDRLTGYATGRGPHRVDAAVESGVRATGRAVGEVADNTSKAATGQP
jgi:hypothetical protein